MVFPSNTRYILAWVKCHVLEKNGFMIYDLLKETFVRKIWVLYLYYFIISSPVVCLCHIYIYIHGIVRRLYVIHRPLDVPCGAYSNEVMK